jgi:hypothetical protein
VIMLTKQYMSSDRLCGPPLLLCLAERLEDFEFLPSVPTEVLARNDLPVRSCEEYLKTASLVEKPPWRLREAAAYLRSLVDNNQRKVMHRAPLLHFVGNGGRSLPSVPAVYPGEWEAFAPRTPTQVVVRAAAPALPKRRRLRTKTPGDPSPAPVAAQDVPPELDALRPLGCSKCRQSARGCAQCKKRRLKALAKAGEGPSGEVVPRGLAGPVEGPVGPEGPAGEVTDDPMEICSTLSSGGEEEAVG